MGCDLTSLSDVVRVFGEEWSVVPLEELLELMYDNLSSAQRLSGVVAVLQSNSSLITSKVPPTPSVLSSKLFRMPYQLPLLLCRVPLEGGGFARTAERRYNSRFLSNGFFCLNSKNKNLGRKKKLATECPTDHMYGVRSSSRQFNQKEPSQQLYSLIDQFSQLHNAFPM
ncbi:hypothetical protein CEXT_35871 [Caerostris extrusa]|uniref:Uncharacterized protein n=1 Tax=Caerostris extrusa TaxID=172846 RepID=A0AAV4P7A2_CAEEX|nr:hypothetical protein CEXT_35871 [Caerostris extrusa]